MKLELATFNLKSCRIAANVGVHRLELCEDYLSGGLTPSTEFFEEAKKLFHGEIVVMIRPRKGNFIYSAREFESMMQSMALFKSIGADGFVAGFLNHDHTINEDQLHPFVKACSPLPFTFHRAFDEVRDWKKGLDVLLECGCTRVLTSGDGKTAEEGKVRLQEMIDYVKGEMIILPGGGIRSSNLENMLKACQPTEIHSAGITQEKSSHGRFVADEMELKRILKLLIQ